jgi:hypothetical protein
MANGDSARALEEKVEFSQRFLDGRRGFNAQHVVRCFLGSGSYSKWDNPKEPKHDVLIGS